jgi:hypothetical protein
LRFVRKVLYWKDRGENRLQTGILAPANRVLNHKKLIVGLLLHLDQIWHLSGVGNVPEALADTFTADKRRLRHLISLIFTVSGLPRTPRATWREK